MKRVDLGSFCLHLRAVLERTDLATAVALLSEALALRRELELYRKGVRKRTLEQAARVAALDRKLGALTPGDRLAAIRAHWLFARKNLPAEKVRGADWIERRLSDLPYAALAQSIDFCPRVASTGANSQ